MEHTDLVDELIAGRYQVTRHLGVGAMGSVYLAKDTQLKREVALKVLRGEWVNKPEVAKRLDVECGLMAHLGPHNNIITLFDRVNHGDSVVLVMEYVPGENVADVLDRVREMSRESESSRKTTPVLAGISTIALTPDDAIAIVIQCLNGLDFAHSRGVIHRDIKPANIMVSRDHNGSIIAKIADFGIGKALVNPEESAPAFTALTRAGGPDPGTPAYMAPEQIDQQRFGPVGPAADLYALGVTLYELLALNLPFGGSYTELMHLHTNVPAPDIRKLRPGLSGALAGVVNKSLAKEQKDRYESAHHFKLDLAAASRDVIPAYENANYGERRSPIPLIFAVIAVIALSVGGYFYYTGGDTSGNPSGLGSPGVSVAPASQAQTEGEGGQGPGGSPGEQPTPPPEMEVASGPPQAVEDARNAVGALAASQKVRLAGISEDKVPAEAARADAAWREAEAAYADKNWDIAATKYDEAKSNYESAEPALAALMEAPTAPADPAQDPAIAEFHAAKNSANGAREGAKSRFGGKEPTGTADYNTGLTAFQQAEALAAQGNYAGARAHLVKAEQSFNAAKPVQQRPVAPPVPPVAPVPEPQAPSQPAKASPTEPPKAGSGFRKAGETVVRKIE